MSRDQPVWLLKIGKTLREQGEQTAVSTELPGALKEALDRLAASEQQLQRDLHRPDGRRRRSG